MTTEGTALEGVLQQERDASESEDANGEQPSADNDTDQNGTNGQVESLDQTAIADANLDGEAEVEKQ